MSDTSQVLRQAEAERDSYYQDIASDITYPTHNDKGVITVQPYNSDGFTRCPLPISTANLEYGTATHLIPFSGIQLLNDVEKLYIQQTVELNDLYSKFGVPNRYVVKTLEGGTMFKVVENSNTWERLLCRSKRSYQMHLFDQTEQEAMYFERRLACPEFCFPYYLQKMDVFSCNSEFIGSIEQKWSPLWPQFIIKNAKQDHLYYIVGPKYLTICNYRNAKFKIISPNGLAELSRISCEWDSKCGSYKIYLTFPLLTLNAKIKVLLMASAFLLEYMFFEMSRFNEKCWL